MIEPAKRPRSIRYWVVGILAVAVAVVLYALAPYLKYAAGGRAPEVSFTQKKEDQAVFYRLKASYLHKGEQIDFDIVAACNVSTSGYADGSTSIDTIKAPPYFVKATNDGGAIAQKVSYACRGETTANGRVPKDFLPGVVWFDDRNDLSLGVAYVTEEGFKSPHSVLQFLGATISTATRSEWDQFMTTIDQSLVSIKRFYESHPPIPLSAEALLADPWNKQKLALYHGLGTDGCRTYQRFYLANEDDRAEVRKYWPTSKPRYWTEQLGGGQTPFANLWHRIREFDVGGVQMRDYALFDDAAGVYGFPTKGGGGLIGKPKLPSEVYGVRRADGIPWLSQAILGNDPIKISVDVNRNLGRGLFYCYSNIGNPSPLARIIPGYEDKTYSLDVDGAPVTVNGGATFKGTEVPDVIFENDEFVFVLKFVF